MTITAERLAPPRTTNAAIWVSDVEALCRPDSVEWIVDEADIRERLTTRLIEAGTIFKLNPDLRPNSYLARSTEDDVARVEGRTFICTPTKDAAGPNNNWRDPVDMRSELLELFSGSMTGRVMYVIPFSMGPEDSPFAQYGIQITDSAYVALSMLTMTRSTARLRERLTAGAPFVAALHSVGYPLHDDSGASRSDVAWPSNSRKYICHFPQLDEIWSFGSGYGGNALLGKKCFALRIASHMGRKQGWMAEHMLLIRVTSPKGKKYHLVAAFPSACGKTNLAMLQPSMPGWKVETLGDDIVWMRLDEQGQLRAMNPENGFFGVAPGTSTKTNPVAMETVSRDTIFTNVALTPEGDVWWEGMTKRAPSMLTDWLGNAWTPESGTPAAHPNSRFTSPVANCPTVCEDWEAPEGVVVDGIIFGGRRADTAPLVTQAYDWEHGVLMGATIVSERTAAAEGTVGELRPDPFAMSPFLGYSLTEHWRHWLEIGEQISADAKPEIFHVNWFRKAEDGSFAWPGFGENIRVIDWMIRRIESQRTHVADRANSDFHVDLGERVQYTPAGIVPETDAVDTEGFTPEQVASLEAAVKVDEQEWRRELERQQAYLEGYGTSVPLELHTALAKLRGLLK